MPIYQLTEELAFPHPSLADKESGLLAVGGDLSPQRLLLAYENAIFPWYSEEMPICWYAPNPRFVLFPERIKITKSLQKIITKKHFTITENKAFEDVVKACKFKPRPNQEGTWITAEMQTAYIKLHNLGFAKSIEVWEEKKMVGGLYGVDLNHCFFGESMFFHKANASKVALVHLAKTNNFKIIDCQMHTPHLENMGAEMISLSAFLKIIQEKSH